MMRLDPMLKAVYACSAMAVVLFVLFLFYGCTQPPIPPGPVFAKVNGEPTAYADDAARRGEDYGKEWSDMVPTPRFPIVYFDFDSDSITAETVEMLAKTARSVRASFSCSVDGFASEEGDEDYNLALGARRADRVGTFISAFKGLTVLETSYGEERPAAGGPERSRRVEVSCR
ncbi:MAG: OmpA family protein [Fibrobacteria bacterium]